MEAPREPLAALRADAVAILLAGVSAADPALAVRAALQREGDRLLLRDERVVPLRPGGRIWLVGAGKAAGAMAAEALALLGDAVAGGCITVPRGSGIVLPGIEVWEGGHPVPDLGGMAGAAEALAIARCLAPEDLLLCLLSGGASSLWTAPADGLTLGELQVAGTALLASGATIGEINAVRKHLSRIGGGGLARAAMPCRTLTLAISDVIGASPDAIGSGPTLPDTTTFADALEVVERYGVDLPAAALHHLRIGASGGARETARPGDLREDSVFEVILDIRTALAAAAEEATRRGFDARVMTATLEGEARDVGTRIAVEAERGLREDPATPAALLWGGETTVTLRGTGRGGRSQELALAAAVGLRDGDGIVLATLGTDGRDGPTEAAGAVVDGGTTRRGTDAGLDAAAALAANDSHTFLRATGDLIVTGPTGTNVNDLVLALRR